MRRIGIAVLMLIIAFGCGKNKIPSSPEIQKAYKQTNVQTSVDSSKLGTVLVNLIYLNQYGHRLAKLAAVDRMVAYVFEKDGNELTRKDLTREDNRAKGKITVQAGNDRKVDVVALDSGIVKYIGSDNDVDVKAGETTETDIEMIRAVPLFISRGVTSTTGTYTLTWRKYGYAEKYLLQESQSFSFATSEDVYADADTTTTIEGKKDGRYYYRVKINTKYGDGAWSKTDSVVVKLPPPPVTEGQIEINVPWPPDDKPRTIRVDLNGKADFLTIQEGINAAVDGDTVFVMAGEYPEAITVEKQIVLMGAGTDKTLIYGGNSDAVTFATGSGGPIITGFRIWSRKSGIVIENSSPTIVNNIIDRNNGNGISSKNSSRPTITHNTIGDNDIGINCDKRSPAMIISNTIKNNNTGIECLSSAIIRDNEITGSGKTGIHVLEAPNINKNLIYENDIGILCESRTSPEISNNNINNNRIGIGYREVVSGTIIRNLIVENKEEGISGLGRVIPTATIIISNNLITGNGGHGIAQPSTLVINNVISKNNKSGVFVSLQSGDTTRIINNIIVNNQRYGTKRESATVDNLYNDVWGNSREDYYQISPGLGDISEDPLFVDPDNGDYHLRSGSPCVDAGRPGPEWLDPDGSRNDMGAYGGPNAGPIGIIGK